jgi:RNA polymerase sigma-70 factor, ECF subfamily
MACLLLLEKLTEALGDLFNLAASRRATAEKNQRIHRARLSYLVKSGRMVEVDNERDSVRASQAGDHAAFETLIRRHQRMIHSLTYRMTGSLADAEDLAQETFIQAWEQLAGFRAEAKFSSWLYRIAVNLCLNWRKREARRAQALQDCIEPQENEGPDSPALAQQVQAALLKLPPKQRAAVVLTTYDGLNHAQASRLLGCSETTVSWRVFAARAKLKRLLKDLAPRKGDKA